MRAATTRLCLKAQSQNRQVSTTARPQLLNPSHVPPLKPKSVGNEISNKAGLKRFKTARNNNSRQRLIRASGCRYWCQSRTTSGNVRRRLRLSPTRTTSDNQILPLRRKMSCERESIGTSTNDYDERLLMKSPVDWAYRFVTLTLISKSRNHGKTLKG